MGSAYSGEGSLARCRVLRIRRGLAPGDLRPGLPAVRLRPLGELAGRLHAGGHQDAGPDLGSAQAQEPQGRDAQARRLFGQVVRASRFYKGISRWGASFAFSSSAPPIQSRPTPIYWDLVQVELSTVSPAVCYRMHHALQTSCVQGQLDRV